MKRRNKSESGIVVYKLTMANKYVNELKEFLWKLQITMAHLQPTQDNVATTVLKRVERF